MIAGDVPLVVEAVGVLLLDTAGATTIQENDQNNNYLTY